MILDRTQAPAFNKPVKIKHLIPEKSQFDNGLNVYSFSGGVDEVLKIELHFPYGGSTNAQNKLVPKVALNIMQEGTSSYTANEISEIFDFYGAWYSVQSFVDYCSISLYALPKFLDKVLPVFKSLLTEAVFTEESISRYIAISKQKLEVNLETPAFTSKNMLKEMIYGREHTYGYHPYLLDFDTFTKEDLLSFYNSQLNPMGANLLVSGQITNDITKLVDSFLGKDNWGKINPVSLNQSPIVNAADKQRVIVKADAVQSAISIGAPSINRMHKDYGDLRVLLTAFGGYFGSRLMKNIREDKGYTYGIYAGLVPHVNGANISISSEVGVDVTQNTINEISFEAERLQNELIPAQELEMVKQYMCGMMMGSIENIFSHADKYKILLAYDLDENYYDDYFDMVVDADAQTLRDLAGKYLNLHAYYEVVVGKK